MEAAARDVGAQARQAQAGERGDRRLEEADRFQQGVRHHGHHHVQLELSGPRRPGDRLVAPQDLEADHVEHLAHHRVDLARHDRRPGLHGGQLDLRDPGRGARGQEAQVVGDLPEVERQIAQRAGHVREIGGAHRDLDQVGRGAEPQACLPGQLPRHEAGVARVGVQPGPRGRGPQVETAQRLRRLFDPDPGAPHDRGVGAELLAEHDRHGVLKVRARRFHGAPELSRQGPQRGLAFEKRKPQPGEGEEEGEAQGGGEGVIGRLRHVDVIVRMDPGVVPAPPAQDLDGPVGDHLVQVHVLGRAGARLVDVHDELVEMASGQDLRGGAPYGGGPPSVEKTERAIHRGGGELDVGVGPDEHGRQSPAADRKVQHRAPRLNSVVGPRRHGQGAERIALDAHGLTAASRSHRTAC